MKLDCICSVYVYILTVFELWPHHPFFQVFVLFFKNFKHDWHSVGLLITFPEENSFLIMSVETQQEMLLP